MLNAFAKSLEPLRHQHFLNLRLSHSQLYVPFRDKNFGKLKNAMVRDMSLELKGPWA